ncbi:hypothetical protein K438DRAFT_1887482, partial [Mycena galopus ATCC 62051]
DSLLRIHLVRRIFERIRICRQNYSVLGPNYLWHHDAGLIRWLIVIHGASDNNRAETVLELYLAACREYSVPSHLRGDHGTEKLSPGGSLRIVYLGKLWNQHRIQIHRGPSRSPVDMFVFDMLINGVRGNQLPDDVMSEEELEVYGIDWEGLRDDALLDSQWHNNPTAEGATS